MENQIQKGDSVRFTTWDLPYPEPKMTVLDVLKCNDGTPACMLKIELQDGRTVIAGFCTNLLVKN